MPDPQEPCILQAPASRSVVLRMAEGGPPAKYAAKLPSTPENMAACKAKYEANKVPPYDRRLRVHGEGRARARAVD